MDEDGGVDCWAGRSGASNGLDHGPVGEFSFLDSGYTHACGVRTDGSAMCWGGEYEEGEVILPGEQFKSVSAFSEGYSCGIRADDTVVCWKYLDGTFSDKTAPAGSFRAIDGYGGQACGIRTGGPLLCWNGNSLDWQDGGFGKPPEGSYIAVSVGDGGACASRDDGTVVCWGNIPGSMPPGGYGIDEQGIVYSVSAVQNGGVVTYIAVGENHSCQWQSAPQEGTYEFCWGRPDVDVAGSGEPTYKTISAGSLHTCAVSTEGKAVCWGYGPYPEGGGWSSGSSPRKRTPPDLSRNQTDPPQGDFLDTSAGYYHTCGLRTDRSVVCWGHSNRGQATSPGGEFTDISAGTNHTCGLRPTGEAVCWGDLDYRGVRSGPPMGKFSSIAAGDDSACGIRSSGAVECWGGSIPSPRGEFVTFEIGGSQACGITAGLEAVCQSWTGSQRPVSWVGPLATVSLGGIHQCGIRTDGSLLCWGGGTALHVPPGGRFKAVSAGRQHTCALRTTGSAVCWGLRTEYGQTTPPGASPTGPYSETGKIGSGTEIIPTAKPTPRVPLFLEPETPSQVTGEAVAPKPRFCSQLCSQIFWYEVTGGSQIFWYEGGVTFESVKAELDLGADPSLAGDQGATALHWAVKNGADREIIKLLLDRGAEPASVDPRGATVLHLAARHGASLEVISLLLEHGADPETRNYRETPVLTVAARASIGPEVVRALLDHGADANPGKDNYGDTPLSVAVESAAYHGDPEIVRLLLENGADATEKYFDEGFTILHIYYLFLGQHISSGRDVAPNPAIVKLLLDHGSGVSAASESELFGGSLLFVALHFAPEPESIRLLLDRGASATATIQVGYTPLHFGVLTDFPEIVSLLLKHGADASARNDDGNTPLHLIAQQYEFDSQVQAEIVALLIDHGADTRAFNRARKKPCDVIDSVGRVEGDPVVGLIC